MPKGARPPQSAQGSYLKASPFSVLTPHSAALQSAPQFLTGLLTTLPRLPRLDLNTMTSDHVHILASETSPGGPQTCPNEEAGVEQNRNLKLSVLSKPGAFPPSPPTPQGSELFHTTLSTCRGRRSCMNLYVISLR